jgi:hypothetical protein
MKKIKVQKAERIANDAWYSIKECTPIIVHFKDGSTK